MPLFSANPAQARLFTPNRGDDIDIPIKPQPLVQIKYKRELEEHPVRKLFPSITERVEPKSRDSTAMRVAYTCWRKYFYQIVLGYMTREKSVFLAWGSAYHLFREHLSINYGYGDNTPRMWDEAKAQQAFAKAAYIGLEYWKKHGVEQPAGSKYEQFTTERFLRSLKTAYEHWKNERQQGLIKVLAVEQIFNVQLKDGSFTTGKADEIVLWRDSIWGRDFKTTSKDQAYFSKGLTPNDQFTRYTFAESKLAGKPIRGIIAQALYNGKPTKSDTKGPLIYEIPVERTAAELATWEDEQVVWNKMLQMCRETDTWPMTPTNCSFCEYHKVCQQVTEPAREHYLKANYTYRPWDPGNIEDD